MFMNDIGWSFSLSGFDIKVMLIALGGRVNQVPVTPFQPKVDVYLILIMSSYLPLPGFRKVHIIINFILHIGNMGDN